MKSLFSPLEFENEELNIKGRLIHMVLVSVVILILIFVLVIPFVSSESARRSLLLAIPISIAIIALVRYSKLRLAGSTQWKDIGGI